MIPFWEFVVDTDREERKKVIECRVVRDNEAGVWIITSVDLPGLVVENERLDDAEKEMKRLVAELVKLRYEDNPTYLWDGWSKALKYDERFPLRPGYDDGDGSKWNAIIEKILLVVLVVLGVVNLGVLAWVIFTNFPIG